MFITPRAYMAGLGQADAKPAAPAPAAKPAAGLSAKGFLGAAALGAAAGAALDYGRYGHPEPKDLAPAAGVGSLVGLGLAALWHFGAKGVGGFAASVAAPPPAQVAP